MEALVEVDAGLLAESSEACVAKDVGAALATNGTILAVLRKFLRFIDRRLCFAEILPDRESLADIQTETVAYVSISARL